MEDGPHEAASTCASWPSTPGRPTSRSRWSCRIVKVWWAFISMVIVAMRAANLVAIFGAAEEFVHPVDSIGDFLKFGKTACVLEGSVVAQFLSYRYPTVATHAFAGFAEAFALDDGTCAGIVDVPADTMSHQIPAGKSATITSGSEKSARGAARGAREPRERGGAARPRHRVRARARGRRADPRDQSVVGRRRFLLVHAHLRRRQRRQSPTRHLSDGRGVYNVRRHRRRCFSSR